VSGVAYEVGDELSPGVTIVAKSAAEVTTTTTFSEAKAGTPGLVRYAAWAFDDLLNYGPPAGDYTLVPMPAQNATVQVAAASGAVTITSAATHTNLAGTATFAGGTLTVELTMRNDTTRVVYAPKAILTSTLPGGIVWSNSDGTIGTTTPLPYRAYGGAIVPGSTATATWIFTGATSTTTLDLSLEIKNGPVVVTGTWDYSSVTGGSIVDAELGGELIQVSAAPTGQGGGSMTTTGGITPDGYLIVGARTAGTVSSFDVQTGARIVTTTLRQQKAFTPRVILDRSGTAVYALVAEGHPQNIYSNGAATTRTELVRMDASTLTVTGRLVLGDTRTRNMDISPDGRTLVIASGVASKGVYVIDLATFTLKRTILPDFRPQVVLYAPALEGGPSIVIVGEFAATYQLDGTLVNQYPVAGTSGKVLGAALAADGKLWVARKNETVTVDLSTGASAVVPLLSGWSIAIHGGTIFNYASGNSINVIDDTGAILKTLTGFYAIDGHWIGRSPF
jgi:hypothetical protein